MANGRGISHFALARALDLGQYFQLATGRGYHSDDATRAQVRTALIEYT